MASQDAVRSASTCILEGALSTIVVADTDGIRDIVNKDLTVADLAGAGGLGDGRGDLIDAVV